MFETDMKEKRDTEMTITDVEPAIVEKMIRYVYSEKFTNLRLEDVADVMSLYSAANKVRHY